MTLYPNAGPLFGTDLPPASHAHDPAPSHIAEHRISASGTRATHCQRVYEMVEKYPRMTAVEYMAWTGLTEYQVRRRLTDLKHLGRIRIAGQRKCRTRGTVMSIWECA